MLIEFLADNGRIYASGKYRVEDRMAIHSMMMYYNFGSLIK
jgi:hypothetical protein